MEKMYIVYDQRARVMELDECIVMLATKNKKEAIDYAKENNGVVGYYDVKVFWCDKCASNHNRHLVETWG